MRVEVMLGNIVDQDVDAIVNAANPSLLGGGGVDGAIHRAAGPELKTHNAALPEVEPGVRCRVGKVVVTPGFKLKAKWILHTVGPMFPSGRPPMFPGEYVSQQPTVDLYNCLVNVLDTAQKMALRSLAIPAISCGVYGCEVEEFTRLLNTVHLLLKSLPNRVYPQRLVVALFTPQEYNAFRATWSHVQ